MLKGSFRVPRHVPTSTVPPLHGKPIPQSSKESQLCSPSIACRSPPSRGPALDFESDRFDLSECVKDFITHLQPEGQAKYAHPSVSFSNLSVFDTGSELQLQASRCPENICGELHILHLDGKAVIHYNGIPQHQMAKEFQGEVLCNHRVDKFFLHLSVGQTLEFAATVRPLPSASKTCPEPSTVIT
ncbi:hypothetical protein NEUTE2DRAFT_166230 [Neurospora tetrasperma FGSC 2509]|nr:hypothetical protein NEUTE2DRAFT_166230 [Neurospora tetrasperma FGSC 2509]